MLPEVEITKADMQTGVVRPSDTGVCAIIAACSGGTLSQPTTYTKTDVCSSDNGFGPLPEFAAYMMPNSGKPIVGVKSAATTVGAYGTITNANKGTATPAATSATHPFDDFDVAIFFLTDGVLATEGITYQWSLDGGVTRSAILALGTALIITIPNTGLSFTLGTSTQTVLAGQTLTCHTTRPLVTTADLTDDDGPLEALRLTTVPFECVLIDGIADAAMVSAVNTWVLALNLVGRYPTVIMTARPWASDETNADYRAALATVFASATSLDIFVCADEADVTSPIRGVTQARPFGLFLAARMMKIARGVEPAYVELGPLPGVSILDTRGNPKHHNEARYPGIDDLRLVTARSFEDTVGVFVTNTKILSPTNSDYVFAPHARVMNRACEIAYQVLTKQLSAAIAKDPKPGPNGERYIHEAIAQRIEGLVQIAIDKELKGQVSDIRFTLSRTDDISSNQGAVITCQLQSVALAYAKKFQVTASYVKQITPAAAGT